MSDDSKDIQLKFDGEPVRRLGGAPADALIASLAALQRMVHIIGMRSEGRNLSERLKPTAKVKRDFALICKAPETGSYIQPFDVANSAGIHSPPAIAAREKLLRSLKAFDSGDESAVENVLPNARERWFMAQAALGLLPPEDSGLDVTIRSGSFGPFSFKADRARALLQTYKQAPPPSADVEDVAGKLRAIDFSLTILTIKPGNEPAIRLDYPMQLERWLTANVRRRIKLTGTPRLNQRGDITTFQSLLNATELEPTLEPIVEFKSGNKLIRTRRPLSIPITVDWSDRMFVYRNASLGIDTFCEQYEDVRMSVLSELDFVWRHYALAEASELDDDAQIVRSNLKSRFTVVD